jgi:uncharacterized protein YjcR
MSGGAEPAAAPDWAKLRQDYESGARRAAEIAAAAGVSWQKLMAIARRDGWTPQAGMRPKHEATRATLKRLKGLLQQRLAGLETQIAGLGAEADAAVSERDIRSVNTLVRTLEKVLELERKDRAARAKRRRHHRQFDDAEREALAQKLEGLRREHELAACGDNPQPAPARGAGSEP